MTPDAETSNLVLSGIAAGGGAARRLNEVISGKQALSSWGRFTAELLARMSVSIFVGFVCLWTIQGVGATPPENVKFLAVAMGGWSGGEIMSLVAKLWKSRFFNAGDGNSVKK